MKSLIVVSMILNRNGEANPQFLKNKPRRILSDPCNLADVLKVGLVFDIYAVWHTIQRSFMCRIANY